VKGDCIKSEKKKYHCSDWKSKEKSYFCCSHASLDEKSEHLGAGIGGGRRERH